MMLFSRFLFLVSICVGSLAATVLAEDVSATAASQCGDPNSAQLIDVTSNFTSLLVGAVCSNGYSCDDFLIPKEIHWHIYPTPQGTEPRQFIFPEGLVTPQVRNGVLSYELQNTLLDYFTAGDRIQAGISLYIPEDRLASISIAGVEQWVQIHADDEELASIERAEPLVITDTTIDSHIFVTSPYWKVDMVEDGFDNEIHMDVAAGSTFDVGGVDIDVYVRCPELASLRTRGVDNDIVIDGTVVFGSMEGVDADIEINDGGVSANNNPCANVTNRGVSNDCDETNDDFITANLSCLADTKVGYQCSYSDLSSAAQWGISVGVIAFVAAIIVASVFCCKCCCCRHKDKRKCSGTKMASATMPSKFDHPTGGQTATTPSKFDHETVKSDEDTHTTASVLEAEVLEVKDAATVGTFENVDLESAKQQAPYNPHVY